MDDEQDLEGVPKPGEIVLGKYRVDRVIGRGGMGCVVSATHTTLDQPVAIKFLLDKAAKNPKNLTRFTREAQAAAKIKSDHVAKVSDVGTLDSGVPYMVMEFLDGEDLSERVERGPMPLDEAVRYLLQASEALAEAHRAGIVHRDLKPANLFLAKLPTGEARVKVLDFGISKIQAEPGKGDDLTRTSALMGSPLYMSPEQMMSAKDADGRTDIWALGCILFELLTGQPPFIGATLPEICSKILTAPHTPLQQLLPGTPPALAAIVDRTLCKKPEERFQNLAELATALAPFGGEHAHKSAAVIQRVLGVGTTGGTATPPPTQQLPTAVGYAAPATAAQMAGAQGSWSTSQPGTAPDGVPSGALSAAQSQPQVAGAAQSYPQPSAVTGPGGVAGSGPHGVVGAATPAPGITTGSGAHAAALPTGLGPTVSSQMMMQGASTAAPVAQTFDGEARRRRGPLLAIGAIAAMLVVGALAFVGLRGSGGEDSAAATHTSAAQGEEAQGEEIATPAEPSAEPAGEPSAQSSALPSASASAAPDSSAAPSAEHPVKRPVGRPVVPRPRATRQPGHTVKKGDDLFN